MDSNSTAKAQQDYTVAVADWSACGTELSAVRRTVFVLEQQVPEALEWDGLDPDCVHAVARAADGAAIGTGRLLPDGRIGRMAVLSHWRGQGVGAALLQCLLQQAQARGDQHIHLHAQVSAVGFYARAGFVAYGEEFMDAGIRHLSMAYPG